MNTEKTSRGLEAARLLWRTTALDIVFCRVPSTVSQRRLAWGYLKQHRSERK